MRHPVVEGPEGLIAPAVFASDFDGALHLVALTDTVEGWELIVTLPDGSELRPGLESFSGGYFSELHDQPCWYVDDLRRDGARWRLEINGASAAIDGTHAGTFPPTDSPHG